MEDRKYYVLCEKNCKFEGLTKEQILTAIAQTVETGEIKDVDSGFITTLKEQNSGVGLQMWIGTQAEYNALTEIAENCFYIITDDTTEADIAETLKQQNNTIADVKKYVEDKANATSEYAADSFKQIKEYVDDAIQTKEVDGCIVISETLQEKEVEIVKALYVQGNIVQLYVEITGSIFSTDKEEIDVCTINDYVPLCSISVICSGYGATYANASSHANAKLTPNGDGTATLRVTGQKQPTGGMCMTATWLI